MFIKARRDVLVDLRSRRTTQRNSFLTERIGFNFETASKLSNKIFLEPVGDGIAILQKVLKNQEFLNRKSPIKRILRKESKKASVFNLKTTFFKPLFGSLKNYHFF